MSYYPTLAEDLARAKAILAEGKAEQLDFDRGGPSMPPLTGGTIFGKDTYAAYRLLESFVAHIAELERERDALLVTLNIINACVAALPDEHREVVRAALALTTEER